jgi:threonine/homoserine/homoserine lactone efflux protein
VVLSVWIAFVVAATIVLVVPGPTILLVISQSVRHGRTAALPLVAGVAVGDFIAVMMSLFGLGVILAASATLFTILKWLGAIYLIFLGVQMWRSPSDINPAAPLMVSDVKPLNLFAHAALVTALNPKGIIFFMAFAPQFVSPEAAPSPQLMIMAATFLILAVVNASLYAWFAAGIRKMLTGYNARTWLQRGSGSALIGAGLLTATIEK